jgi:hypothetical protein
VSSRLNQSRNFANCALIFAIFVKFLFLTQSACFSSSTMAAADIDDVKSAIDDVDSEIEIEQRRIEHAEKQMETADPGDRRFLQEVKIKLLESANVLKSQKKVLLEHLRDAKNLLLKKETQPGNVYGSRVGFFLGLARTGYLLHITYALEGIYREFISLPGSGVLF